MHRIKCSICESKLEPVYFIEYEYDKKMIKTGRKRKSVDYLMCNCCGKKEMVDDSLDGNWYN